MAIDIRKLRYFVAVAEAGHMTRAAESLGIQQPPLSLQIKALEQELGVRLFRRESRGLSLTEAGKTLLSESRPLLAGLEHAVEITRSVSRGEQGELRLGLAPTAPFIGLVPRSIREFSRSFPDVRLTLGEGLSHEMQSRLITKQVDVAFVRNTMILATEIVVRPLSEEPMILAMPSDQAKEAMASDSAIPLESLADQCFILVGPPGTGLHDETIASCVSAGFQPKLQQIAPQITSTLGLVAAGLGVALVPDSLRSLRMEGVVYRTIAAPRPPKAFLGLAFRTDNPSPILRRFTAHVEAAFGAASRSRHPAAQSLSRLPES
ncbi:MAG: LysR family transcriptional regulator [Methylocystis sp.]|jgi:DNA-binding transcriptional LysR family regulator|nr:LysR family transcriptional regulator [Methylocystis sp.]MCA3582781.1 LysR family transcriptional regulator [Methylocystis sp.]MCA3588497.1 LysR family transcriptional regulator [Methylocystis sp.]MCA3592078.1 LysR family transcriptional regulator [Methylocystis sp.]